MPSVVAFEDIKSTQEGRGTPRKGRASAKTVFFRSPDNPDLPDACLSEYDPGRSSFSGSHFHTRDQFQVVVAGTGKIGRHELAPYCVHFSRAYTPYGPVVTNAATGLHFFVIRARRDGGAHHLPEALDELRRMPDRSPWQISRTARFSAPSSQRPAGGVELCAVPDMADEHGLGVYALTMAPHAQAVAPDPAQGDGQYLVLLAGSLQYGGKECSAYTLAFTRADESAFRIEAGPQGLQALILNFPRAMMHC